MEKHLFRVRSVFPISSKILIIVLIILTPSIFLVDWSISRFIAAGNRGRSYDAGKWGKKADDQKNIGNIIPTPGPVLGLSQDSTPPILKINYPPDGFSSSTIKIGIRASASDDTGISHVNFYINGVLKYVDTVPEQIPDISLPVSEFPYNVPGPEYNYHWTPPAGKTTYLIEVAAYDYAHNATIRKIQMRTY